MEARRNGILNLNLTQRDRDFRANVTKADDELRSVQVNALLSKWAS